MSYFDIEKARKDANDAARYHFLKNLLKLDEDYDENSEVPLTIMYLDNEVGRVGYFADNLDAFIDDCIKANETLEKVAEK